MTKLACVVILCTVANLWLAEAQCPTGSVEANQKTMQYNVHLDAPQFGRNSTRVIVSKQTACLNIIPREGTVPFMVFLGQNEAGDTILELVTDIKSELDATVNGWSP